jgi:predicted RND superfamily exporter protein
VIGSERFWERWLGGLAATAIRWRWRTIALAAGLAAVASISVAMRLEIRTSNLDLLDPALPEIVSFRSFARLFGTPNMLVVAIRGGTEADRIGAVSRVAAAARDTPGVKRVLSRPPFRDDLLAAFGLKPYFATRDGRVHYLFVQPADAESAATTIARFVDGVSGAVAGLHLDREGLVVGYTGLPRYALDDRDVIQNDIARASVFSFLGILALYIAAYRGLREPLVATAVLGWSALVTAGIGAWVPGHLTLVSAFFFSILFGLGIDFGVHVVDGAEELAAAGESPERALAMAVRRLAPGLGTGAATTALSFFVLLFSGFRAFGELGFLAGCGVLVALFGMVTLLPALLLTLPRARRAPRPLEARRSAARLARWQRPWLAAPLALAAIAVALGGAPRFDGDYLDLQAADSEAVRLEREMVSDSELAPQFAAFVTRDAAAAARLAASLRQEPTVATVRSAGDFDRIVAYGGTLPMEWEAFRSLHVAADGSHAVYAFPRGDVWNPAVSGEFLRAMRRHDPAVTGMPVLGELFEHRSIHALRWTALLAALALVALVFADLGQPVRSALALLPTAFAVAAMLGIQRIAGLAFNPINLLALPVVLGVSEDAGVHLVHRYVREGGDLARTLAGAGRAILVCSATTLVGFGALVGARHRGLASLAQLLTLGVALSTLFTLFVLPVVLDVVPRRWLALPERKGPR